ncbi:MAG: glycosyltransferase [Bacteroidaceae bacterium]|nr:glycosyltransferase [Bacteroidaceae bacterium]MBQ9192010.1 glycosyltransferase [Bacteroidaceae bacterium]
MNCSLIISVYKNTRFLRAVLHSLYYQTVQDFEVIISEDGESTEMKEFLSRWPFNTPWQHLTQPDEGWRKNRALNRAICAARANHLIFIDGDCVLHPRFIEMHERHFHPNAILAGKRALLNQKLSERIISNPSSIKTLQSFMLMALLWHRGTKRAEEGIFISPDGLLSFIPKSRKLNYLTGCNMSFSREAIEHINGFDEDYVAPAYGEDTDLVWRFQMAGYHFISLRNLAVQYHLWHPLSWTDQNENMALGNSKRMRGEYRCLNGLSQYRLTSSAT